MGARYDQHFLVDPSVADAAVAAADLKPGETVLEIGPGRGVLTERLLARGVRLTAVEIDPRLAPRLQERFTGRGLEVVHADWLKLDLSALPEPSAVVANLPYSVGTPILQSLLQWPVWERAVLMFQKEVAERLLARPGGRDYGVLTLSAQVYADVEPVCEAPAACFRPPPKVDSAVVRLRRLPQPRLPEGLPLEDFFAVAKAAFSQRRKRAAKALAAGLGLDRARVEAAFREAGLDLDARAERLSLEAFAALALRLK